MHIFSYQKFFLIFAQRQLNFRSNYVMAYSSCEVIYVPLKYYYIKINKSEINRNES